MLGTQNLLDYEELRETLMKFKLNEKNDNSSKCSSGLEWGEAQ
jgi:hypothetical protein